MNLQAGAVFQSTIPDNWGAVDVAPWPGLFSGPFRYRKLQRPKCRGPLVQMGAMECLGAQVVGERAHKLDLAPGNLCLHSPSALVQAFMLARLHLANQKELASRSRARSKQVICWPFRARPGLASIGPALAWAYCFGGSGRVSSERRRRWGRTQRMYYWV